PRNASHFWFMVSSRPGRTVRPRPSSDPPSHRPGHIGRRSGVVESMSFRDEHRADDEALDAYSRVVTTVAERLSPSVASLRVIQRAGRGGVVQGAGSGVVISSDGFAIT